MTAAVSGRSAASGASGTTGGGHFFLSLSLFGWSPLLSGLQPDFGSAASPVATPLQLVVEGMAGSADGAANTPSAGVNGSDRRAATAAKQKSLAGRLTDPMPNLQTLPDDAGIVSTRCGKVKGR